MRCISVLGPSQSGKSTLIRALSGLDGQPVQAETLGPLALTTFRFLDEPWCALDLPGGAEFVAQASGALMASDAAVLVVGPAPDAAVLAAPWLRAIEASRTPCVLFINKIDGVPGRLRDTVAALQGVANHTIVLRQIPIRAAGAVVGAVDLISERAWHYREGRASALVELPRGEVAAREHEARTALLEHMSEYDDHLLEDLIDDHVPAQSALFEIARRELAQNVLTPAFLGAASHLNGVTRLMKALRHEVPGCAALSARLGGAPAVAFQAALRKHLGKVVAVRSLDAPVSVGTPLGGGTIGGLILPGGAGCASLSAGEVALTIKADHLAAGRPLDATGMRAAPDWAHRQPPMLARVLVPGSERDEVRLSGALARLAETDTSLTVGAEDETGLPQIAVQGPQHLRRVLAQLEADFGLDPETRAPHPTWCETISGRAEVRHRHRKQSGGAGQFAEVALVLGPRPRGTGFAFDESVKGGAVPRGYIPSVAEGAREAMACGPLGFPVVDVAVTLTDGKHHAVDSSDHAFRTAGRMAVREGLALAAPQLLQGIDRVTIHVPSGGSGALVALVSGLKGQVLGFDADPGQRGWDVFRATLPSAARDALLSQLAAATQGTAWVESAFDHFEEIHGREAEAISRARLSRAVVR
ncbi:MAG: elongation factor G [Rhodobacteraceae bacterium]|nr:elongation factor G [Paracoccaceae bacterium]